MHSFCCILTKHLVPTSSLLEMRWRLSSICLFSSATLREFCKREGEAVTYRKGDQLEREGDPARWFAFVTEGCFKYVTHDISDDREHITLLLDPCTCSFLKSC